VQSLILACKCQEALLRLVACAHVDPAAYEVLVNLTATHAEILETVRALDCQAQNRQTQSHTADPQIIPALI
jgi:hypothetical protein